jgi:plastocyanin
VVLSRRWALTGLLLLAPAQARGADPTGTLSGVVDVNLDLPAPPRRPDVAALGSPPERGVPDRRRSVVYLETAPRGAFEERERPPARLDQRDETFVPYVLAIEAGTAVEFPNDDATYHNVFSLSKTRRFDLGRYPKGHSKSVVFDRPGIVRVFCDIHSHMSAWILVFAHRFFDATSPDGRYHIPGIPPGRYQVAVWTDGRVRVERSVTIPEGGGEVRADFVVE